MQTLTSTSNLPFKGACYDPLIDLKRLEKQIGRVWNCMIGGRWRTLEEIEEITKDPQASISAELRHLRKPQFGGYTVNKRRRGRPGDGLFEYQILPTEPSGQLNLFPA